MRQMIGVLLLVAVAMSAPAPQNPTFFFTSPVVSPGVLSLSPPALPQPQFQPQPQPTVSAPAPAPAAAPSPVFTATHFQGQDGLGQFRFGFANTDGQVKTEMRHADTVVGMYRYISPEGQPIEVSYVADKNGFQATPVAQNPFAQQAQAQIAAQPAAPAAAAQAGPVVPPELAQAHAEANLRLAQAYRDAEIRLAAAKQKAAAEALANAIAGASAGGQAGAAEGGEVAAAAAQPAAPVQQQPQQQLVGFPISLFPSFG
ncbi:hypothetical protein CHUAL_006946 [Chamberlinius hualienensis]